MTSRADELDQMKRIDLRVIAARLGFEINGQRSSRGSTCMDHPSGDRILIGLATDGHFVWCAVKGHGSGTCIDLWQQYSGGSIGEVRKQLRPFLSPDGTPPLPLAPIGPVPQSRMLPNLRPIERDILGVQARYAGFSPLGPHHAYLCAQRGIPAALLAEPVFADRLRLDERCNTIFPHFNASGVCGWEARNNGFVSFAAGGTKGLWASVPGTDDDRLVIAESGIDALSYAAVKGHERARFISFSGGLNNEQPALIQIAMQRMAEGSTIVLAVDHDEAGNRYLEQLAELHAEIGRADLELRDDRPTATGTDWNDALRAAIKLGAAAGSRPDECGDEPEPT